MLRIFKCWKKSYVCSFDKNFAEILKHFYYHIGWVCNKYFNIEWKNNNFTRIRLLNKFSLLTGVKKNSSLNCAERKSKSDKIKYFYQCALYLPKLT